MYFNGFDNCGRPAWIMRPRFQNSKDEDKQVKYIVFCLERGIRLMPPNVENLAIVVDFKDALYAQNPSVSTCKKFLDILGNHYPERLGCAYVLKCKLWQKKDLVVYQLTLQLSPVVLLHYFQAHFAFHGSSH